MNDRPSAIIEEEASGRPGVSVEDTGRGGGAEDGDPALFERAKKHAEKKAKTPDKPAPAAENSV